MPFKRGCYQALHEAGIEPDWVIGTSIGAINAALIAGNPPAQRLERLQAFWRTVEQEAGCAAACWGLPELAKAQGYALTYAAGIAGFFAPNPLAWLGPLARVGVEQASYYSTAALRDTLGGLTDFGYINAHHVRMALGAVKVASGEMRYFDSRDRSIEMEHILASCAIPPAFGAVRVEDDFYWDGGIYSNTPIEAVLEDHPRRDSLIFAVDLWSADGPLPRSLWEVQGKQKDIQYASRAESHTARQQQIHHLRHVILELAKRMPASLRTSAAIRELSAWGCKTTMHIARFVAPNAASEDPQKDIDFSTGSIRERWQAGYTKARDLLLRAPWTLPVDPVQGLIIHY